MRYLSFAGRSLAVLVAFLLLPRGFGGESPGLCADETEACVPEYGSFCEDDGEVRVDYTRRRDG